MANERYIITYKRKLKSDPFTFVRTEPRTDIAKDSKELNIYIDLIKDDESIISAEYRDVTNNKVTKIR